MDDLFTKALRAVKDGILFPTHCIVCGKTAGAPVCGDCGKYLEAIGSEGCAVCSGSRQDREICPKCASSLPSFRRCSSVFAYNEVSAAIVKKAKYGGGYVYLEFMAEAIAEKAAFPKDADFLTCIPMHPAERLKRTYDHNILLGKLVSKKKGLPFYGIFKKTASGKNQASLGDDEEQRRKNVKDTFSVKSGWKGKLKGKCIVICDDVTTSGATLNELSALLRKEGAVPWCVTFANARFAPVHKNILLL
ncbi:MAG: ComF family protein [Abditibacteriota bacterium]|nr:ComF family protein [Abditibacteriota bacterium]